MDERHGSWGQFGTELACKAWLSGGEMVTSTKTWCAHLFRTGNFSKNGESTWPYPLSQRQVDAARPKIFVQVGIGNVGGAALAVTTTVGIVTIAASTYMILYSEKLYEWLKPLLGVFERQVPYREVRGALAPHDEVLPEVIVFGMGRYGRRLAEQLQHEGHRVLGVDFDPELVRGAAHAAVHVRFGDASDPGLLDDLPLASTRWAVVTLPEPEDALALVAALRARHYRGRIALAARSGEDMRRLSRTHPDLLLRPFQDAADHAARTLITSMES